MNWIDIAATLPLPLELGSLGSLWLVAVLAACVPAALAAREIRLGARAARPLMPRRITTIEMPRRSTEIRISGQAARAPRRG